MRGMIAGGPEMGAHTLMEKDRQARVPIAHTFFTDSRTWRLPNMLKSNPSLTGLLDQAFCMITPPTHTLNLHTLSQPPDFHIPW